MRISLPIAVAVSLASLAACSGKEAARTSGSTAAAAPTTASAPDLGAKIKDPLVGKWKEFASRSADGTITGYETTEFLSDGTWLSHLALSGRRIASRDIIAESKREDVTGKWTRLEGDRVKMERNGQEAGLYQISVSGDVATMAVIYENGYISTIDRGEYHTLQRDRTSK